VLIHGIVRFAPYAWTDDTDQALLIILSYLHGITYTIPPAVSTDQLAPDFAARLRIWIRRGLLALNRLAMGIGVLAGSVVRHMAVERARIQLALSDSD
jgi:hypothetical protein